MTVPAAVTLIDGRTVVDMSVALVSNAGATTTLTPTGGYDLLVYGVLSVGANQVAGTYAGTYNVTVFYQ